MDMKHENGSKLLREMELIDDALVERAATPPAAKGRLLHRQNRRVALSLAASFALVVVVAAVVLANVGVINTQADERETYLPNGRAGMDYWLVRPQAPYVDHTIAETFEIGMTIGEVVSQIGKANRHIFVYQPKVAFQWDLDNGECLLIVFDKPLYGSLVYDNWVAKEVHILAADHSYTKVMRREITETETIWLMEYEESIWEDCWKNTDETVANPETE